MLKRRAKKMTIKLIQVIQIQTKTPIYKRRVRKRKIEERKAKNRKMMRQEQLRISKEV